MPHPDEGLIHAWLDGELDAAEAARVEEFVASDPEWAAAAAEARGLIAASARIVGALDRVPANVVPKAPGAPRRTAHPWLWRAAAAVVLMAGSAVVLERSGDKELPVARQLTTPVPEAKIAKQPAAQASGPAKPSVNSPAANSRGADSPVTGHKTTPSKKELDAAKSVEPLRDKDLLSGEEARTRRADAAPAIVPLPAPAPAPAAAPAAVSGKAARAAAPTATGFQNALSLEQLTRMPASCWLQLQPPDSAKRIIRLEPGALDDSIRLERLTVRGDTLAAVRGRLTAVRAPCPAP